MRNIFIPAVVLLSMLLACAGQPALAQTSSCPAGFEHQKLSFSGPVVFSQGNPQDGTTIVQDTRTGCRIELLAMDSDDPGETLCPVGTNFNGIGVWGKNDSDYTEWVNAGLSADSYFDYGVSYYTTDVTICHA